MPRRTKTKTTSVRNNLSFARTKNVSPKDMRFSVSLVILIGLLSLSLLLLLFSLNNSFSVSAAKKTFSAPAKINNAGLKKAENRVLDDASLDFRITVPAQLGEWLYKVGEVRSLVDDSLSNQYLRIYAIVPGKKSNNFDQQNKDVLTIRRVDSDEWAVIEKNCQKEKKEICDSAGQLVKNQADPGEGDWVYLYTKPFECPASLEAKCSMAEKIIESFQMK